jgi:hypothetical protein
MRPTATPGRPQPAAAAKADVRRFLAPFTNNLAEGGFRSEQGAADFAVVRSLISGWICSRP